MTTLAEMTLKIAREITEVLDGTATTGATNSITDTLNLTQQNQWWDKGAAWIRSGAHAGKVAIVTSYAGSKLSFTAFDAVSVGTCLFSVARAIYPYRALVQAVNNALAEVRVTYTDETLDGDDETLEFTLPTGVKNLERIEIDDQTLTPARVYPSHHWKERGGKVKWDYGYPPLEGTNNIRLFYKDYHAVLTDYDDEIHEDVNEEWLKWKACEHALYWGIKQYQNAKEYRMEELMNKAMERQKNLIPVPIAFRLRTAGA